MDVGSTWTKASRIEPSTGELVASAAHRTTIEDDVMIGVDAALRDLGGSGTAHVGRAPRVIGCSSAGGGLRIAVIGNEQLITAEAGRSVALSSGGHVVAVLAGDIRDATDELAAARPDVVLLVGGTDGGNPAPLVRSATTLAGRSWRVPVVVAGNAQATPTALAVLRRADVECLGADNVLPRVGVVAPDSARAALREVFLRHVIGGKALSADPRFLELVRAPTPDVVLRGVELLSTGSRPAARRGVGDVVLVDVGGATTDVYSAVHPPEQEQPLVSRTVEGDLGVRWSAPGTVAAATDAGWVAEPERAAAAAQRLLEQPAHLSGTAQERAFDEQLAAWAIGIALRRHAGRARPRYVATGTSTGRWVERAGVDLREVELVVGSGGVLRHGARRSPQGLSRFLAHLDATGGWQLPRRPRFTVDQAYAVAPAGLLADEHPEAAWRLLAPLRAHARGADL